MPVQVACDAEHAQMTAIVIRVSILDQGGACGAARGAVPDAAASARAGRGVRPPAGPRAARGCAAAITTMGHVCRR